MGGAGELGEMAQLAKSLLHKQDGPSLDHQSPPHSWTYNPRSG